MISMGKLHIFIIYLCLLYVESSPYNFMICVLAESVWPKSQDARNTFDFLHHWYTLSYTVGVKSGSGSGSRSKKRMLLGKVSRNFFLGIKLVFGSGSLRFFSLAE